MEPKIMTLKNAKIVVEYAEISMVLIWQSWYCYTDIEFEALEYLVKNSSKILLPNVKELTNEKQQLLKNYKGMLIMGDFKSFD